MAWKQSRAERLYEGVQFKVSRHCCELYEAYPKDFVFRKAIEDLYLRIYDAIGKGYEACGPSLRRAKKA